MRKFYKGMFWGIVFSIPLWFLIIYGFHKAFADEQVTGFEKKDLPVLNNELQKIQNLIVPLQNANTANNFVQLSSSSKLPAVDGSQLTNLTIPAQVGFSAWATKSAGTIYQATKDGFVRITKSTAGIALLLSDANATPSGTAGAGYTDGSTKLTYVFPVIKNNYWNVPSASLVEFMSSGT